MLTYAEIQTDGDDPGLDHTRLATAVFRAAPGAPNGAAWFHLHEVFARPA